MKTLIALIAVLAASSAFAEEKVWVDPTCQVTMTSENNVFTIALTDGTREITCKISSWPISDPVAEMECSDGSKRTLFLAGNGSVVVAGTTLFPKGSPETICD